MKREIEYNIVRDRPEPALVKLKQKLNGYRYAWERVYIGVTSDPDIRWGKHSQNNWHKMVCLYEAFTPDIAFDMERDLINYARSCGFRISIENISPGGEGITAEHRSNYLYVLVGERREGASFY